MKSAKNLAGVTMMILLAFCSSNKVNPVSPRMQYKTAAGWEQNRKSYEKAMLLWPIAYSDEWVETSYGRTHIVVSGSQTAQPLFLIPGLYADATMWYANIASLSEHYRVFALDMINYGGLGKPSGRKIKSFDDYGDWFVELLDHYGYERVAIGGLSYGGALSLHFAGTMKDRIAAVILLDPAESFIPMDGGIAWRGMWAFGIFPSRKKYSDFFDWIGGGYTDAKMDIWFEHLLDVIEYGTLTIWNLPPTRIYTREELRAIGMPVLVLAGGKPILYRDPVAFASAAMRSLPQAWVDIVPGTGHGLNMEKPEYVNGVMLRFLRENYSGTSSLSMQR